MNKWAVYLNLVIPVFIEIFIIVFCEIFFLGKYDVLSNISMLTKWIILPSILLVFNLVLFFWKIEFSFLRCCIFMFSGLLLGEMAAYIMWGAITKHLLNPDGETLYMIKELIIFYVYFVIIFLLTIKSGQFILRKFLQNRGRF